jgi:hypothetical protein
MLGASWRACALVAMVLAVVAVRADDIPGVPKDGTAKSSGGEKAAPGGPAAKTAAIADEGKLEAFKGKKLALKEKGEASFTLSVPAGKEVTVTVASEKKSDVNLFVYDAAKKEIAKDVSPGPDCKITFTPKEAGKITVLVRNLGPGENSSTVKASVAAK